MSYLAALTAYEAEGKHIIDATVDGACPVFERADYKTLFNLPQEAPEPCQSTLNARMQKQQVSALSSAVALHHDTVLAQQSKLDDLYHSTSWRVTRPLRALRRALGNNCYSRA